MGPVRRRAPTGLSVSEAWARVTDWPPGTADHVAPFTASRSRPGGPVWGRHRCSPSRTPHRPDRASTTRWRSSQWRPPTDDGARVSAASRSAAGSSSAGPSSDGRSPHRRPRARRGARKANPAHPAGVRRRRGQRRAGDAWCSVAWCGACSRPESGRGRTACWAMAGPRGSSTPGAARRSAAYRCTAGRPAGKTRRVLRDWCPRGSSPSR